ncbi:acyltransferase family protein [Streptomyces spectabilis]|uniref:Acyltransferase n=1 Tax=Streptomyces spectabilis TaxID=68270 RepID=A0A516R6V2_STRST|nr:acyltransferase [Streptomyces spectabilis]QDQ11398.1 acyltransferase [Streptomyces spectabilis]
MLTRLPSLTGLRFVAALMVFATHVVWYTRLIPGDTGADLRDAFALSGSYGVGFFFILSGFVLAWTARPSDTTPSFWRRRLVKIGPMHWVTFGLAALFVLHTDRPTRTVDWLASLTMQQAWFPDIRTSSAVNGVSWSLACEFFFYLAFPVLFPVVRRMREEWLWPALGVVLALIVGAFLVATYAVSDQPGLIGFGLTGEVSFDQVWFVYFFPPVRALEFVLGIVLARIVAAGRWPRIGLVPAFALAVAGYVLALKLPYLAGTAGVSTVWTAPLIAAAAVADRQQTASVFRRPTMVFLGEISFAFYMVHWILIMTVAEWIGPTRTYSLATGSLLVLALLAAAVASAAVLYWCVERPLMRRFGRHRPAAAAPARPASPVRAEGERVLD